jgi:hypothetical protein
MGDKYGRINMKILRTSQNFVSFANFVVKKLVIGFPEKKKPPPRFCSGTGA